MSLGSELELEGCGPPTPPKEFFYSLKAGPRYRHGIGDLLS